MNLSHMTIIGPRPRFDCPSCGVHQPFGLNSGEVCHVCDKIKREADCYRDGHKPGNPLELKNMTMTFCKHCLAVLETDEDIRND